MKKNVLIALACGAFAVSAQAAASGKPFAVHGERVDAPVPADAKLAYMAGESKGQFIAEYIHKTEDVKQWRKYLIAQQRVADTLPNTVKRTLAAMQQGCRNLGQPRVLQPQDAKFKGKLLVLQVHCPDSSPGAPFGELTAMAFLQGKDATFKYWHAWRPESAQSKTVQQGLQTFYQQVRNQVSLCNPQAGQACQHNSLMPK